jgi:hypothetical protein
VADVQNEDFVADYVNPEPANDGWRSIGCGTNGVVCAITAWNGGIVIGGSFSQVDGATANNIAFWNGGAWVPLGAGLNGPVNALAVYQGDVYAGGTFTASGTTAVAHVACWNGETWSNLGAGFNGDVKALAAANDVLYAGGVFTASGGAGVARIARWNGASWSAMGSGFSRDVNALVIYGGSLIAGGQFNGSSLYQIARWDGAAWRALGNGLSPRGNNRAVYALAVSGGDLIAGGVFDEASGISVNNIARWNGSAWSQLGDGLASDVYALAYWDGRVVAGYGGGSYVTTWDGASWTTPGQGTDGHVLVLTATNTGLYAGGSFQSAGGLFARHVARWNYVWSAPSAVFGDGTDARLPSRFAINCAPNPFNPATTIEFELPMSENIQLAIFDTHGRRIRVLVDETRSAGRHKVRWDGTDDTGRQVATGVYLCRMAAGAFSDTKRMTLIK